MNALISPLVEKRILGLFIQRTRRCFSDSSHTPRIAEKKSPKAKHVIDTQDIKNKVKQ